MSEKNERNVPIWLFFPIILIAIIGVIFPLLAGSLALYYYFQENKAMNFWHVAICFIGIVIAFIVYSLAYATAKYPDFWEPSSSQKK